MSTKIVLPCSLVLAVLGVGVVRGQDYRPMPRDPLPPPGLELDPTNLPAPVAQGGMPGLPGAGPGLSQWITYQRPECCGNIGGNGPIGGEIYVLTGIELPAEGKIFGHVLETGWVVQGGGRTLFFNPAMDRDWNIDLSVSNILNRGQRSDIKIPLNLLTLNGAGTPTLVPNRLVSVREMNRTYVNAAFGRDWYMTRPEDCWIHRWRVGLDAGARLGSAKTEFNEVTHRQDVIGGMFCTLSMDMEIPCGCCTFWTGMRAEWGYNWGDVLQRQNDSDLQDVNILFTAGVRF